MREQVSDLVTGMTDNSLSVGGKVSLCLREGVKVGVPDCCCLLRGTIIIVPYMMHEGKSRTVPNEYEYFLFRVRHVWFK